MTQAQPLRLFLFWVLVPIRFHIFWLWPNKRKWTPDWRCFHWDKDKEELHFNWSVLEEGMEIGYVCRIVTWLWAGCQHYKKSKRTKSYLTPTLIIDFGLRQCQAQNSLFLYCKVVSRLQTSHQRVWKQTCWEVTTIFLKRITTHVISKTSSRDCCFRWPFSTQSFWRGESTVQLGGTFLTSGWTRTLRQVKCSSKCTWMNSLTSLTKHSTTWLPKSTMVEESPMTRMWDWSLHCYWATWTLESWQESTVSPVLEFTSLLWTSK